MKLRVVLNRLDLAGVHCARTTNSDGKKVEKDNKGKQNINWSRPRQISTKACPVGGKHTRKHNAPPQPKNKERERESDI